MTNIQLFEDSDDVVGVRGIGSLLVTAWLLTISLGSFEMQLYQARGKLLDLLWRLLVQKALATTHGQRTAPERMTAMPTVVVVGCMIRILCLG